MSMYPTAGALLDDARFRLDTLEGPKGILVVEGPDDVRLFQPRMATLQQVVVSGGRRMLLSAYEACSADDLERIAFVTDCDFEVGFGTLRPAPSLFITRNADVEADFLEIGLLRRLVVDLVPAALADDANADRIVEDVLVKAMPFAEVIGQVRRVAKVNGQELDLSDIKYARLRDRKSGEVDEHELITRLGQQIGFCDTTRDDFAARVVELPRGYMYVNGKDLMNAVHFVLRTDYRVDIPRDSMPTMFRLASGDFFDAWSVAGRLRGWEARNGRTILA